jgi:hypothetical protein
MTLLMGMRASEVVNRVTRDVDDGGRLLWIPEAKTRTALDAGHLGGRHRRDRRRRSRAHQAKS